MATDQRKWLTDFRHVWNLDPTVGVYWTSQSGITIKAQNSDLIDALAVFHPWREKPVAWMLQSNIDHRPDPYSRTALLEQITKEQEQRIEDLEAKLAIESRERAELIGATHPSSLSFELFAGVGF